MYGHFQSVLPLTHLLAACAPAHEQGDIWGKSKDFYVEKKFLEV